MQENPQRQVKMLWKDKTGAQNSAFSAVLTHDPTHVTQPLVPDSPSLTSLWYDVPNVLVDVTQSISTFWFEVDEGNGSPRILDQGGAGYEIQDAIMISTSTCASGINTLATFAVGCMLLIPNNID